MIIAGLTSHALHLYFIQHTGGFIHRHESVYHLNRAADIYTKLNKYQNTITDPKHRNTATVILTPEFLWGVVQISSSWLNHTSVIYQPADRQRTGNMPSTVASLRGRAQQHHNK